RRAWLPGARGHAVRATAGEADGRRGPRLPKTGRRLRERLRVRAGHHLPILVTVAAPAPSRVAGAAACTALTITARAQPSLVRHQPPREGRYGIAACRVGDAASAPGSPGVRSRGMW